MSPEVFQQLQDLLHSKGKLASKSLQVLKNPQTRFSQNLKGQSQLETL